MLQLQTLYLVAAEVFGRALPVLHQALLLLCVLLITAVVNMACAPVRSRLLVVLHFVQRSGGHHHAAAVLRGGGAGGRRSTWDWFAAMGGRGPQHMARARGARLPKGCRGGVHTCGLGGHLTS